MMTDVATVAALLPELSTSQVLTVLADHSYQARLANGGRLHDAIDFRCWLMELAEELRKHGH